MLVPDTMSPRQKTLALLTLIIGLVLEIVDMTIVNTALPSIRRDMGSGVLAGQWVVGGYALSFALLLLAAGRLGDSYGYARVFLIGVALFTLASLGCGMAPDAQTLVAMRVVQGAAAALMAPQILALVQVLFTPVERIGRMATFGLVGGFAGISGPVIGGLLITANLFGLGWRLIFLINLPVGIAALVAGWFLLPHAQSARPRGLDVTGITLFGAAVAAAIWPLGLAAGGWPWPGTLSLFAAVVLTLAGWRHVHGRVARDQVALFDPRLLRNRCFAIGLAISVVFALANAGFLLVFAFALQAERGQSPLAAGLLHMPFGIGVMFGIAVLGRRLLRRAGRWLLVAGALTMAVGSAIVLTGIGARMIPMTVLIPAIALTGIGMGLMLGGIGPVAMAQVDRDHAGAAGGLLKTCDQLGSAMGITLLGAVYFAWGHAFRLSPALPVMALVAILLIITAVLAIRLPQDIFTTTQPPHPDGKPA